MPTIVLQTRIRGSLEECFDAARDLDLHARSMEGTGERAIAGRTSGLIEGGERVTWRARHFGLEHEHESLITQFERPHRFRDVMVRGRFRSFEHDHVFEDAGGGVTIMRDALTFRSPLGVLGAVVDRLVLAAYLRRLLQRRNEAIRESVERRHRAEWRPESPPFREAEAATVRVVAVHCWARWNAIEEEYHGCLAGVVSELPGDVVALRSLDVDDTAGSARLAEWGVLNVPSLVLLASGRHVTTLIGRRTVGELRRAIRDAVRDLA